MIQSHLYARQNGTPVFTAPMSTSAVVCSLKKGDWLGVLEQGPEGWIRVISTVCDGWVRMQDLESQSPFNLHAVWSDQHTLHYTSVRA